LNAKPVVAKLITFKLQLGKSQSEAIEALKDIFGFFDQTPDSLPATALFDPDTETYSVFAPASGAESSKMDGGSMVSSGAGDGLFAIVDPATFHISDNVVLDV